MRTRIIRLAVSWPMVALGIAMLLRAHLGVAPFDVLNTGVAHVTKLSFTIVYLGVSLAFYAAGVAMGGKIGPASLIGSFVISPLIGAFGALLPHPQALAARFGLMVAATLILAGAVCLVITTDLGAGPTEVFMLGLINRRVPLLLARWISDGFPLVAGALIGGSVGVGTLLFGASLGPLIKIGLAKLHYRPTTKQDLVIGLPMRP